MNKTGGMKARNQKKKWAGRYFLNLLIIVITAGAVFWYGWVQFKIEENEVAVVHTKTGGYESEVLRSGEFAWRWEALFPTNLTLHTVKLENQKANISIQGMLPSGDQYAKIAGEGFSFSWRLTADIDYGLNPERIPEMISSGSLTADPGALYAEFESGVKNHLRKLISDELSSGSGALVKGRLPGLEDKISSGAAASDPRFTVFAVNITELDYPDLVLYEQARRLTVQLMASRNEVITDVESRAIRRDDEQNNRLDLLRQYGEVLTEYPVLLELFALEGNPGRSLLP
jgi:hypothetical protein